jgi:hypothetical protein
VQQERPVQRTNPIKPTNESVCSFATDFIQPVEQAIFISHLPAAFQRKLGTATFRMGTNYRDDE